MEKRGCLVVLLLVLIIVSISGIIGDITGEVITGDTITGEATQNIGMNISIIAYFPVLTIVSPQNKTYLINESLSLNYTVRNEQSVWYNLDNSANITITSNLTFNVSEGSHTLYLYANSSYGNLSLTGVTFFVNLIGEVVETPSGRGGGGGSVVTEKDFFVDQAVVKVLLKQEESFKTSLKIKNTENTSQNFQLSLSPSLDGLIFLSENNFSLKKGEEKIIFLIFSSDENTLLGVHTGNLEIKGEGKTKEIPVIFSIKSKEVLFDVSLDIPLEYKEILSGEELVLQLTLFNLADIGKTDVSIEYIVKDFEGNTLVEESEVVTVETQVSFSKTIKLPLDVELGDYLAIVQVRYGDSLGSSSDMFHVIGELEIGKLEANKYFIIVLFVLIILVIFIIWLRYNGIKMKGIIKSQKSEIKKVRGKSARGKGKIRESRKRERGFGDKMVVLEKAFKEGYIKESSYLKGKERIKKLK